MPSSILHPSGDPRSPTAADRVVGREPVEPWSGPHLRWRGSIETTTEPRPEPPVRDLHDRDELERLMASMAAGDQSAALTFAERFAQPLAVAIRRHLRDLNRDDVARDSHEVDSLVIDAALLIADHAAAWKSDGGAQPWTWAHRAIRSLVVDHVGHALADVGPDDLEHVLASDGHGSADRLGSRGAVDFHDLADLDPTVDLLRQAIADASPRARDAAVHVEYQVQKGCGDRSPAVTVAAMFDLTPANVRQIDRRVRRRVLRLAEEEPAFAVLRDLPWLGVRPAPDDGHDEHGDQEVA